MGDVIQLYPELPEARAWHAKTVLLRAQTGGGDCNVAFATVTMTRNAAAALIAKLCQFDQAVERDRYLIELVFFDLLPRLIRFSSKTAELLDIIDAPGPGFVVIDEYLDLRAATLAPARWSRMRVSARGVSWNIRPRRHGVLVKTGVIPGPVIRAAAAELQ